MDAPGLTAVPCLQGEPAGRLGHGVILALAGQRQCPVERHLDVDAKVIRPVVRLPRHVALGLEVLDNPVLEALAQG